MRFIINTIKAVVPNFFCSKGHLFFMEGIEGHTVDFFTFPHLFFLTSLSSNS